MMISDLSVLWKRWQRIPRWKRMEIISQENRFFSPFVKLSNAIFFVT